MNQQIAIQWAEALESGKYKQGKSCLMEGDTYCCLGVLQHLVYPESLPQVGHKWFVTEEVVEKAALASRSPSAEYGFGTVELTALNDDSCLSFKEIAALIREQWQKL